ncbi:MAG: SCO family protein [Acidobacteria bacterium]|nr:SCO family protein [Acidobacteriota bacterium]
MTTPPRAPHRLGTLGFASLLAIALATAAFAGSSADAPATNKAKPAAGASGSSCCAPTGSAPAKSAVKRTVEDLSLEGLTLVDMDGREVALDEMLPTNRPVLLNFIFTTCTTICPVMTATFATVEDTLHEANEDAVLVSISIDPERDNPARLREYARRFDAGPDWLFLTGTQAQSEATQRAFGAASASKFNHAPLTFLRAPDSSRWVRLEGLGGAEVIVAEYRRIVPKGSRTASLEKF